MSYLQKLKAEANNRSDKSQHFAIIKFNNFLAFGYLPFFTQVWFQLCMNRILFAAKHIKIVLFMSRPFAGSYYFAGLWWALSQ